MNSQAPLSKWLLWVESCVEQCFKSNQQQSVLPADQGRQLIMRWSLFTSLLLRDLTLKGGHSFGSFHLLRLLLDEYVQFQVERRLEELETDHAHSLIISAASGYDTLSCTMTAGTCTNAVQSQMENQHHPGLRHAHDVLLSPSKTQTPASAGPNQRWQRTISEESMY